MCFESCVKISYSLFVIKTTRKKTYTIIRFLKFYSYSFKTTEFFVIVYDVLTLSVVIMLVRLGNFQKSRFQKRTKMKK